MILAKIKPNKVLILSIAAVLLLFGLVWTFSINHDWANEKDGNHRVETRSEGLDKKAALGGEDDVSLDDLNETSDGQYQLEESYFVDWKSKLSSPAQLEKVEPLRIDRSVPLIEEIDGLIAAAVAGDADAAWQVAASLGHCINAPQSERQLQDLIDRTSQTHQVEGRAYPVLDVRSAIKNSEIRYQFCKGIEKDQALDHLIYLKLAAEHGNRQAQINFDSSSPLTIEDMYEGYARVSGDVDSMMKDHAQFLLRASEAGYLDAFVSLGRLGENGHIDMSIVEAKALQIAGHHLLGVATGDRSASDEILNLLIHSVGPNEAEAAIRRANQIIQSENCCTHIEQRQLVGEKNENRSE